MEIINTILEWPVIVQGALGSLLFWISFEIVKKSVSVLNSILENYNKNLKKERLTHEYFQKEFNISDGAKVENVMFCLYAAVHHIIKGIIIIIIGWVLSNIISLSEYLGYTIALFYFFRALTAVKLEYGSSLSDDEQKRRMLEIKKELKELYKNDDLN